MANQSQSNQEQNNQSSRQGSDRSQTDRQSGSTTGSETRTGGQSQRSERDMSQGSEQR